MISTHFKCQNDKTGRNFKKNFEELFLKCAWFYKTMVIVGSGLWSISDLQKRFTYYEILIELRVFPFQFQKYAMTISRQIDAKRSNEHNFGQAIKPEEIDLFSGEQLAQLYELYNETTKPQDEYPA